MNALMELLPLGTARSFVGKPAAGLAFPEKLPAAVAEYDLPGETVTLAWEIAKLARSASPGEKQAILVLALASLIAARQGSTRVPLAGRGENGEASDLETLAARLRISAPQIEAIRALLEQARVCL